MSNYLFTYRFVTGEVRVVGLCELVARGELTSDAAVKLEITLVGLDEEEEKNERRETRRHSSLEKLADNFVPLEIIARHIPPTPEESMIRDEMVNLLREAMESCLTETQHRRVIAHYGDGKTYRQIADAAGVNEISVRHSVKAAMGKLKKYFEKI